MSIRARMLILPFSILLHYSLTKTSDLTFTGCHNVRLKSCSMVMATSVRAPSWHDDVRACALTFLYHINCVNSDLRRHFLIDGYGIFPSLRRAKSYPRTMSVYDLCISFPFSFVSTLWRYFFVPFPFVSTFYPVLSPSVSTLDYILSPPVSMLDSISSWFDLNLTKFTTPSLIPVIIVVKDTAMADIPSREFKMVSSFMLKLTLSLTLTCNFLSHIISHSTSLG